ncbi:Pyrimidine 5'-nucleotidase YjjG [Smittium culicis]|uniref:Pyrimidine 5'-nucleotidase YjjG n=1 Tax=Smittium culicis TaxID=133412 RepID=A0A1R1YPZ9_9FUNG|nr:Pyrimidine 5'-nucleotidase YjjG [Smittium culicis]
MGLLNCFEFVLDSGSVGFEKPSHKIWDLALEKMGSIDKTQVLHVGDHYKKDFLGALDFGFNAILVDRENRPYSDGDGCNSNIPSGTLLLPSKKFDNNYAIVNSLDKLLED